jgi:hypothetical protein
MKLTTTFALLVSSIAVLAAPAANMTTHLPRTTYTIAVVCTGQGLAGLCVPFTTNVLPSRCINTATQGMNDNIRSLHVETATVFFT